MREDLVALDGDLPPAFAGQELLYYGIVTLLEAVDEFQVGFIPFRSESPYAYEGVGAFADGRQHEDRPVVAESLGDYLHHLRHNGGVGYRRTAEFEDLHINLLSGV